MWAPQMEILAHPSIGRFLSHCGWNSTLETLVNGVPIIAWPLYAEQYMNAALLEEEIGVAIRPKVFPTKRVVSRDEIKEMITNTLAAEVRNDIRAKVKEVQHSAKKALLTKDGSSYKSLSQVANNCENRLKSQRAKGTSINH
ncbi:Anthocyanidin 3-O-glucosyltransferase 5 [Bienertia sinuspersici]